MPEPQTIPLTDEEIVALAHDPEAVAQFNSDERRRMVKLVPAKETISAHGYWKELPGPFGTTRQEWQAPEGAGSDRARPDNSILGLPPEAVVVPALGIGRAVAGATGAAPKVVAGVKAAASQAAPAVKYEATRTALEAIGIPPSLAIPVALAVSGYKAGAKPRAPRAPKATTAAPATSPAAVEPTPAPQAAAAAEGAGTSRSASSAGSQSVDPYRHLPPPEGGGIWSPQRVKSEVGLAYRRSAEYKRGLRLSDDQIDEADRLVAQGKTPVEAVREVAARAEGSAPVATSQPAAAPPPKTTIPEAAEYVRLRRLGKTHEQALAAIEEQKTLAEKLGTPSPETVAEKVSDRNKTGRWK